MIDPDPRSAGHKKSKVQISFIADPYKKTDVEQDYSDKILTSLIQFSKYRTSEVGVVRSQ